jgi:hypothetical protein
MIRKVQIFSKYRHPVHCSKSEQRITHQPKQESNGSLLAPVLEEVGVHKVRGEGSSTLEPSLRLKEMGARVTTEVGGVVRCADGRSGLDTGAVVIASVWSTWQSPVQ